MCRIYIVIVAAFCTLSVQNLVCQEMAMVGNGDNSVSPISRTYRKISPRLISFDKKIVYEYVDQANSFGEITVLYNSLEKYCGIKPFPTSESDDLLLLGFSDGSMVEAPINENGSEIVRLFSPSLPGRNLDNASYNTELEYSFFNRIKPTENTIIKAGLRSDEFKGVWVDGSVRKMLIGNIGVDTRAIYSLFANVPYKLPQALVEPYYLAKNQFLVESQIVIKNELKSAVWLKSISQDVNTFILTDLIIENIDYPSCGALDFLSDTKMEDDAKAEVLTDVVNKSIESTSPSLELPVLKANNAEFEFDIQLVYELIPQVGEIQELYVSLDKLGNHVAMKSSIFGEDIKVIVGRNDGSFLYHGYNKDEEYSYIFAGRGALVEDKELKSYQGNQKLEESIVGFSPYLLQGDNEQEFIKFAPVPYSTQLLSGSMFSKLPFFPGFLDQVSSLSNHHLMLECKTAKTESGLLTIRLKTYREAKSILNLKQTFVRWIYE